MSNSKPATDVTMKRLNIEFGPVTFSELESLKEDLEATSLSEVIRRTLKFFRKILSKKKDGATFFMKEKDGTITEFIF
jgi:predicted CopG family antitoxin